VNRERGSPTRWIDYLLNHQSLLSLVTVAASIAVSIVGVLASIFFAPARTQAIRRRDELRAAHLADLKDYALAPMRGYLRSTVLPILTFQQGNVALALILTTDERASAAPS
jgi:hypothetical protein